MEWPTAELRSQDDRHQIERTRQEAARTEFRLPGEAGMVGNVDLPDPEPFPVQEHRDVAMEFSVEFEHLTALRAGTPYSQN